LETNSIDNSRNVNAIHFINLDNQRIPAKNITEILVIPIERVGYIIHEILAMRMLSTKWDPKCLSADRSMTECFLHKPFWTYFGTIMSDFLMLSKLKMKLGYISLIRR
jgi:hypothetical protein